MQPKRTMGILAVVLLVQFLVVLDTGLATTYYSYEDEKGTVMVTDKLVKVPPKYRARAKQIHIPGSRNTKTRVLDDIRNVPDIAQSKVEEMGYKLFELLPETIIPGLTAYQSVVLILGFLAGVGSFATMSLTHNISVRLAMKWLLFLVLVVTTYLMYFSELGAKFQPATIQAGSGGNVGMMERVRSKVVDVEAEQRERASQLDRMVDP
ncbi:MAG: hypothetical protein ACE5NA_06205 [Nitrospiraceae bacterium]